MQILILLQNLFQFKGADTKYSIHLENIVERPEAIFYLTNVKNDTVTIKSRVLTRPVL